VTGANRLGVLSITSVAASPQEVRDGKPWLIVTSVFIADRPAVPSLVGFWIVCVAALLLCSARAAAGVAVGGHTLSTLAVYGVMAATFWSRRPSGRSRVIIVLGSVACAGVGLALRPG